ncbi:MAG: hypothetical protein KDB01_06530 [Planctomycetaceae bacterium]|nr:hypothetical protein [Planctomycetaceae bacterium]
MTYAMATGHPPFRAETSYGILRRITDHAHRPIQDVRLEVPPWLCQIIDRLLSKNASDRFSSADEVAMLLEECLAHVQQPSVVQLPDSLRTKFKDARRFKKVGLPGFVVFVATFAITLSLWNLFTTIETPHETTRTKVKVQIAAEAISSDGLQISDRELDWHQDDQLDQIESSLSDLNRELEQ